MLAIELRLKRPKGCDTCPHRGHLCLIILDKSETHALSVSFNAHMPTVIGFGKKVTA